MRRQARTLLIGMGLTLLLLGTARAQLPGGKNQSNGPNGQSGKAGMHLKAELGLSDDQMQKLRPVLKSYRIQTKQHQKESAAQMKSILSADQQTKLQQIMQQQRAARKQGSGQPTDPFTTLNLTPEQKKAVLAMRKKRMQQQKSDRLALFGKSRTILTADQEARFEKMIASRGQMGAQRPPQQQPGGRPLPRKPSSNDE